MPVYPDSKLTREQSTTLRREQIVESALMCFAENGFHQTSIRDIANKAGISLGNLYNYFDGKESLILEIANVEASDITEFENLLVDYDDPQKAINQFVDAYLKEVTQPHYAVLASEILAEAMRNGDIAKKLVANRSRIIRALTSVLAAGVADNKLVSTTQAEITAQVIVDAIEGMGLRAGLQGKKVSRQSRTALKEYISNTIRPGC